MIYADAAATTRLAPGVLKAMQPYMFNAEGDFVEQSIEGYCDSFTRPEQYTNPTYM